MTLTVPEILDELLEEPERLRDPDFMGHVYALYLLSQLREPAAYPRVLRLVRLPPGLLDAALGDLVTEDLPACSHSSPKSIGSCR